MPIQSWLALLIVPAVCVTDLAFRTIPNLFLLPAWCGVPRIAPHAICINIPERKLILQGKLATN
jgi:hypothetical protein